MSKKEKARPGAGTPEQAVEMATCDGVAISCNYSNTGTAGRQCKVSNLLGRGRENAVPLRHLKKLMEVDGRTVRLMIQHERLTGTPICSDNLTGYYLPATEEEKSACVRSMRHRAGEIMRTARAIERGAGID